MATLPPVLKEQPFIQAATAAVLSSFTAAERERYVETLQAENLLKAEQDEVKRQTEALRKRAEDLQRQFEDLQRRREEYQKREAAVEAKIAELAAKRQADEGEHEGQGDTKAPRTQIRAD
jgi:septal ring factor EnvC (AmiA/AmiB activator)